MTATFFDLQTRNGLNPCGIPEPLHVTFAQQCCAVLNAADLAIKLLSKDLVARVALWARAGGEARLARA
jgi:hypothetical protein